MKAMSGFYYVKVDERLYECKARGVFKKDGILPMTGDLVQMRVLDEENHYGLIEEIEPRHTALIRPPIANVTKVLLIFGIKDPAPNRSLIDRFIVLAEKEGLQIVLCFNKMDLDEQCTHIALQDLYARAGYKVYLLSVRDKKGIAEVKRELQGHITVVAGPSGVGKSSLINAIDERLSLKTADVSEKLGTGRHTTRYTQLIDLGEGSLVADTPGFSSLSLSEFEEQELKNYFIEFHRYDEHCRFGFKCIHENEPDCAVKQALLDNELLPWRYESYLQLLREIRSGRRKKY